MLFPPLTGLEALATEVDGSTLLVNTRLSLNMASLTLEQVLSQRRKTLLDMEKGMEGELRQYFRESRNKTLSDAASMILDKALDWGIFEQPPAWFNSDDNFASAVQQLLNTKASLVDSVSKLPLQKDAVTLTGWKLLPEQEFKYVSRPRLSLLAGWLRCMPSATSIDFRDIGLTPEEAEAIAGMITKLTKLTTIDVRANESMGKRGADAFTAALFAEGGALHSLCGTSQGQKYLEVPRKDLAATDALLYAAELESATPGASGTRRRPQHRHSSARRVRPHRLHSPFVTTHPSQCPDVLRSPASPRADSQWAETISAEQNINKKTSKLMLKTRVDGHAGWYPLIWAARDGNSELIKAMLDRGLDIDQKEGDKHDAGYTPLMSAANKGHARAVELLLERGADCEVVDNHKRTAFQLAEARGFRGIADLLAFWAEQQRQNRSTFHDVIKRAQLMLNFKASCGSLNPEAEVLKVPKSAVFIQKLQRGRSERKVVTETTTAVEEMAQTQMQGLAKRAMMTSVAARKLKSPVVPMSKVAKEAKEAGDRMRASFAANVESQPVAEEATSSGGAEPKAGTTATSNPPAPSPTLKAKSSMPLPTAKMAPADATPRATTAGKALIQSAAAEAVGSTQRAAVDIQRLVRGRSQRRLLAASKPAT